MFSKNFIFTFLKDVLTVLLIFVLLDSSSNNSKTNMC